MIIAGLLLLALGFSAEPDRAALTPLPDVNALRERAIADFKRSTDQRERYSCQEHYEGEELNSSGAIKKTETEDREVFFVNGHELHRTLAKNGKQLSGDQARKEEERVTKEVTKWAQPGMRDKQEHDSSVRISDVLRLVNLTNERREILNGRNTILFDAAGNLNAKAEDLPQHLIQAMSGQIRLDEKTGMPMDVNMHTDHDVKIVGGLAANLHKGAVVHVHLGQQPDGVWLVDYAEGSGDARAALFFHPYFRFKQTDTSCKLFTVSTDPVKVDSPKQ